MKIIFRILFLLLAIYVFQSCSENPGTPEEVPEDDILSGGATTVFLAGSQSFSQPAANLSSQTLEKHIAGDANFEQTFVKAPAPVNPGLGPLFNNNSCINCHVSDGRGNPPFEGEQFESMLIRISVSGNDIHNGPNSVPGFGTQLQTQALVGYEPEGSIQLNYSEISGTYPDGETYTLRKPDYIITGRVPGGVLTSPRVAPFVIGLGLLEAIPEETILSNADENDINQDGVSGRPNYVWDYASNKIELGRFGWKANTPTLIQQAASAYNNDMGITSPLFPMENCYSSGQCDSTNDDPEVSQEILNDVEAYVQTLGVPARRNYDDETVKLGKSLFKQVGCNSCHISEFTTGTFTKVPELSNQKIHPYTDLLLHDMGDELADNRPDFEATGSEWRTPPLWGIGLVQVVNGHTFFMHDGRARNLEEAILWHFGEGENSREKFMNLTKSQREALIKYLQSL